MSLILNTTITELAQAYIPFSRVKRHHNTEVIHFSWHQILFNQSEVAALWRTCNHYHLKPVAKTFLGKIRSIKISHDI